MANYYCEVIVEHSVYPPGVYTFEVNPKIGMIHRWKLFQVSHSVWKETEDGVFCVKDKITGSNLPKQLTQDDLKKFVWTKLRAQEVTINV